MNGEKPCKVTDSTHHFLLSNTNFGGIRSTNMESILLELNKYKKYNYNKMYALEVMCVLKDANTDAMYQYISGGPVV